MRLKHKKIKSMVVCRSRTYAPSYGDRTLGCVETLDSRLMLKTHLGTGVSKPVNSLGVACRAGKLLDCLRVFKSCFTTYVLSSLVYCTPVWMLSVKSYFIYWIGVRSAERLWEGKLRYLRHRRKVSALCLL